MNPDLYAQRRQRLLGKLGDGLLILSTARHFLRNGDVHYEFRPASDFFYLTGFAEPQAVLVAWRTGRSTHRSALFVMPRDPAREIWEGRRCGVAGAVRRFGVAEAHPIDTLWQELPKMMAEHQRVFHGLGRDAEFDGRLMAVCRKVAAGARRSNPPAHPVIEDPQPVIAAMRLIKDREEVALMERAAEISVAGHLAAMAATRPGMAEYQVQAELEAEFRRGGAVRNGYPSIVASGANACILHYVQNDRTMRRGELLLIDAGAEFGGYTADITRTFPVSGRFSEPQKAVYGHVLAAQNAGIRAVKPGARWDAPHRACRVRLTKGLVELGVLRGDPARLFKKDAYRKWFMHGTSHWLGMDVHDVGAYENGDPRGATRFRAGMVLTVEPGLYFDARDKSVPRELRGIGVRIEDDVLVTRGGNRVLTAGVPKSLREVEAACSASFGTE